MPHSASRALPSSEANTSRAVNPAAAQPHGVGGVHEVAHHQAAVVKICGAAPVGQHHEHHGGAVERVGLRAQHPGVELRQAVAHLAVGHGHYYGRLGAHACGGVCACLCHLLYQFVCRHGVRLEATHTAACLHTVKDFVHLCGFSHLFAMQKYCFFGLLVTRYRLFS